MSTTLPHNNELASSFLAQHSPRDRKWDEHKRFNLDVANRVRSLGLGKRADRLGNCSQFLGFNIQPSDNDGICLRLIETRSCRVRECPICQWRRSLMWSARAFRALPIIQQDYPGHCWLSLTLTQRNCEYPKLRETVDKMSESWDRFTKQKGFPAVGYIKSLEITKGKSAPGTAHPHYHILMMVKPSYFGGHYYIKHEEWMARWRRAARLDYDPSVHIFRVREKRLQEAVFVEEKGVVTLPQELQDKGLSKAILEVFKYITKPDDIINDPDFLMAAIKHLHGVRSTSVGGVFRKYMKSSDPEDLVSDGQSLGSVDGNVIWYQYGIYAGRYRMRLPLEAELMSG